MKQENKRYFVEGYAIVFDSLSENLGGFKEVIHRGAVSQELIDNSDVFVKVDHTDNMILARARKGEGSVQLTLDDRGLKYRFEVPDTYKGKELVTHLRRHELNQSSFCFSIPNEQGAEKWEYVDNNAIRHIYKISGLYDVAPVFLPAYSETTCYLVEEDINITEDSI